MKITINRCKLAYMNTYGERLKLAMDEAGYGGPGGQTKLAKEIGARSQTINQALSGGSKELSATFHVRVCMRLGVLPLWLSEGKGRRYEFEMVPADPINRTHTPTNLARRLVNVVTESNQDGVAPATTNVRLSDIEMGVIRILREQPDDVVKAVATLVNSISLKR